MATILYFVMLTYLSLTPGPPKLVDRTMSVFLGADHLAHLAAFWLLAGLMWASRWPIHWQRLLVAMLAYATAVELLQLLFPPRAAEAWDLAANLAGVLAATLCWHAAARVFGVMREGKTKFDMPAKPAEPAA